MPATRDCTCHCNCRPFDGATRCCCERARPVAAGRWCVVDCLAASAVCSCCARANATSVAATDWLVSTCNNMDTNNGWNPSIPATSFLRPDQVGSQRHATRLVHGQPACTNCNRPLSVNMCSHPCARAHARALAHVTPKQQQPPCCKPPHRGFSAAAPHNPKPYPAAATGCPSSVEPPPPPTTDARPPSPTLPQRRAATSAGRCWSPEF